MNENLTKAKHAASFLLVDLQESYASSEDKALQLVLEQMLRDVAEIRRKLTYLAGDN